VSAKGSFVSRPAPNARTDRDACANAYAPVVYVVDDDEAVRDSVGMLLETAGFDVAAHAGAETFLGALLPGAVGCVVLDMQMQGMNGLELQRELARRHAHLPIVFLTAHGSIPATVEAMRAGAVDFLTKPVDVPRLLDRVRAGMAQSRAAWERERAAEAARARLAKLTARERTILALALDGLANKEIARRLGISFRTVEVHRSRILLKTGAESLYALSRLTREESAAEVHDASPAGA
jgi:FixJ family two-component response regulator